MVASFRLGRTVQSNMRHDPDDSCSTQGDAPRKPSTRKGRSSNRSSSAAKKPLMFRFEAAVRFTPDGSGLVDLRAGLNKRSRSELSKRREYSRRLSAYCPAGLLEEFVDSDIVTVKASFDDSNRLVVDSLRLTARTRTLIPGRLTRRGRGTPPVFVAAPGFADTPFPVSDSLDCVVPRSNRTAGAVAVIAQNRTVVRFAASGFDMSSNNWVRAVALCLFLDGPAAQNPHSTGFDLSRWLETAVANKQHSRLPLEGPVPGLGLPREDWRAYPTATIDSAHARIRDDALSAVTSGDNIRVMVHVADVAGRVGVGSPLDRRAAALASSLFFSDGRVEHLFPKPFMEHKLSLNPGKVRDTVSFVFEVTPSGELLPFPPVVSRIRSNTALTFDAADSHRRNRQSRTAEPLAEPLTSLLGLLFEAASRLQNRSVDTEPAALLDVPGELSASSMLRVLIRAANMSATTFVTGHGIPALHGTPPNVTVGSRKTDGDGCYGPFTSPIRRYTDLVNHRAVRAGLAAEQPAHSSAELPDLAAWLNYRSGAVLRCQQRFAKALAAAELAADTDTLFPAAGQVLATHRNHARVRVAALGVSGVVPLTSPAAVSLKEGDVVPVMLADTDFLTGGLVFNVAAA